MTTDSEKIVVGFAKIESYGDFLERLRANGFSEKDIALLRFCNYCRTDEKRYDIFKKCNLAQVRKAFDAFLAREYRGSLGRSDFSDDELRGAFERYYKAECVAHLYGWNNGDNKSIKFTARVGQLGIAVESQSRKVLQRDDFEQRRKRGNSDEQALFGD